MEQRFLSTAFECPSGRTADVEENALRETAKELAEQGASALAVVTDVSQADEVEQLAQAALSQFSAVHLLFNNAGVLTGGRIWEQTLADWEWLIGVNLWGVIHGMHTFTPIMLQQNVECHIVNTASLAGLTAFTGHGIYTMTKHAVVSLSETLHLELAQAGAKVGVSVLCPAIIRTRIGEAERNRPAHLTEQSGNGTEFVMTGIEQQGWQQLGETAIEPPQAAEHVFQAIRAKQFYILTHPEYNDGITMRTADIVAGRNPQNLHAWIVARTGSAE